MERETGYDDEDDYLREPCLACRLGQHTECTDGRCACDCLLNPRASVQTPPAASTCKCRGCGAAFPNPYSPHANGEECVSYLCDECLEAPVDDAAILRIRSRP